MQHPALRALLALAAGCLITLSLAPFSLWPLALLALLILHGLLQTADLRQALLAGGLFGIAMMLSGAHWVYVSIHHFGGASPLLAGIMTGGFCIGIGLLLAPFCGFYNRFLKHRPLGTTAGFAAIWLLSEWLKTWLLTGFPWLFVGYSQLDAPLAAWAPVIGTLGISFLLAFSAAVSGHCLTSRKASWQLLWLLPVWLLPPALASIEWTRPISTKPLKVAMVQANIPQEKKWLPSWQQPILDHYRQTTLALADQDLVIWPETAIPEYLQYAGDFLALMHSSAIDSNSAIILGIPSIERRPDRTAVYNSLVGIGQASGLYHKQKLVPFGEYVPLENWLRGLIAFFDLPMSSFSAGPPGQPPLLAHGLRIMPFICYEIVYPDFVSRSAANADLLLTVSNDTWFGDSIGPLQHLQMARMRALETGRDLLRATNNGVTAAIDHRGRVIARLPQFTEAVLTAEVYPRKGLTPVMQYGTLPAVIFSILIAVGLPVAGRWRLPV
ncbi:MAG TPA: apolipoprotein N-acyltransferase [Pseudomonadales bacterium]